MHRPRPQEEIGREKNDRQHHIVTLLRARRSITLRCLQDETGASRATLMRDLAWLRNEVGQPIQWDRDSQTYRWTCADPHADAPQEVAGLWFKPSEVIGLLTLKHLLDDLQPGDLLERNLKPLERRLQSMLQKAGMAQDPVPWLQRIRIIGLGQRALAPQCFEQVGLALVQRQRLRFHYLARGSGERTERSVSPQRLVHYRSNWLLDAWCHRRNGLRSFSLDNIVQPHLEPLAAIDVPADELDQILGSGYGIFSGRDVQWATLRFTPERARWVAAEQWHPAQRGSWDDQGRWVLNIPYSDDRELVMDILRHTPEVEVLGPMTLRQRVLDRLREGLVRWGEAT